MQFSTAETEQQSAIRIRARLCLPDPKVRVFSLIARGSSKRSPWPYAVVEARPYGRLSRCKFLPCTDRSGTWALRVSPSQCIWRVLLISSFVSFLHWKCCLQLIRLTFPGHRKDPFPPETSLNRADVDGSRPRRLFQADFALSISLAGFLSPQRIVTMFGSSLLWQLWQASPGLCASFNVLGNSYRTLSLLFW